MAPARGRKRKSDRSPVSDAHNAPGVTEQNQHAIPTKLGTPDRGSPSKRRKIGITHAQKQALINNLQLEITERARKLRAQYNLQAQGLRTRIEIRINRIPMALRKARIGDLFLKYSPDRQPQQPSAPLPASSARPPPVPAKDYPPTRPASRPDTAGQASRPGPGRPPKRLSDEIDGGDKENEVQHVENPKKRPRGAPLPDAGTRPHQVLSPTSLNTRVVPPDRPASPIKTFIARPASPMKNTTAATSLLSNMVEKARSTRAGGAAATRKTTQSSSANAAPVAKTRRAAPATSTRAGASSRAAQRVSGTSESSDGSTSTVVRKKPVAATKATAPATKRGGVMNTIKKSVTGTTTRKALAPKPAPATTRAGRVLRSRA